ncbi:MAG: transcription termination factor NusA [bacterium JZ-2024 1]
MRLIDATLIDEILALAKDRSLEIEQMEQALKEALEVVYKKQFRVNQIPENLRIEVNLRKGIISMYLLKRVVDVVEDPIRQVPASRAGYGPREEFYRDEIDLTRLSNITMQAAGEVFQRRIVEMERENLYRKVLQRKHNIATARVYRVDESGDVWLDIDRLDAVMRKKETIKDERYRRGRELEVYVLDVEMVEITKNDRKIQIPKIYVSRTHPEFLRLLLTREIPEVANGIVEIVKIVRDPGYRAKVAVRSKDPYVDPVGACIGAAGRRILPIVRALSGERIDIIEYSDDPKTYVLNALSPLKLPSTETLFIVNLEEGQRKLVVQVPDDLYAQAIGKEGRNVRLAARLTEWYINIVKESEFKELPMVDLEKTDLNPELVAALRHHGIRKVMDLFSFSFAELALLEGIGEQNAQIIKNFLTERGLLELEPQAVGEPTEAAGPANTTETPPNTPAGPSSGSA